MDGLLLDSIEDKKDKATVERNVGIISTWIIASLRNQQYLSLRELNADIQTCLKEFNSKPFQKREGSRATVFEEEKTYLLPLPEHHYELAEWKIATVQFNYHIAVDGNNYSVPYEYIKQKVNLRLTKRVVEILFAGNRIASHKRLYGRKGQYSTYEEHMPSDHREYTLWNAERFINWAEKIGEHTRDVVRFLLSRNQVEQQGYKSCMALLKLSDTHSALKLERACEKALSFTCRPSLKSIQIILNSAQINQPQTGLAPGIQETFVSRFTRGGEYYRRKGES